MNIIPNEIEVAIVTTDRWNDMNGKIEEYFPDKGTYSVWIEGRNQYAEFQAEELLCLGPKKLMAWDEAGMDDPLYVPENYSPGHPPLTKRDFIRVAEGNAEYARHLFEMCDWQNPETVWDEIGGADFFLED